MTSDSTSSISDRYHEYHAEKDLPMEEFEDVPTELLEITFCDIYFDRENDYCLLFKNTTHSTDTPFFSIPCDAIITAIRESPGSDWPEDILQAFENNRWECVYNSSNQQAEIHPAAFPYSFTANTFKDDPRTEQNTRPVTIKYEKPYSTEVFKHKTRVAKIEDIPDEYKTSLLDACRRSHFDEDILERHIHLSQLVSGPDWYIPGVVTNATELDDDQASYTVTLSNSDETTLEFIFELPADETNSVPFERLVDYAGGSPSFIPGTEVAVGLRTEFLIGLIFTESSFSSDWVLLPRDPPTESMEHTTPSLSTFLKRLFTS